jgi:DNA polymerase-3 subunit delta'
MNTKIHHANIVVGNDGYQKSIVILNEELMFQTRGNPDFFIMKTETFGIDDARELGKWVAGKPLVGEIKAALFVVESITFEAQNALLKVLEEPPLGTYIFINIKSLGGILPTFLSRVAVLKSEEGEVIYDESDAQKFLKSKIKERLAVARSLAKKEEKSLMKEFLVDMEKSLQKSRTKSLASPDLRRILKAKVFAGARGSSSKILLDWLSCSISQ